MIIALVDEAVANRARRREACAVLGVSARMVERWRAAQSRGKVEDMRCGPRNAPVNKLSTAERRKILDVMNSGKFRDLSPHQIVPQLADEGRYLASESTLHRILREAELNTHRGRAKAPVRRPRSSQIACGPNQVWSWDITYLKSPIRGVFYYLYMIMDVWSRKIAGWEVHEAESAELASALFVKTYRQLGVDPAGIVLHSDNGGPMKGSTMVVTLQRLGVLASYSRPGVSDDNPFSEALFRTLKYRPDYPQAPFTGAEAAREWVAGFVRWYNTEHLHSAISFVTPEDRHSGRDKALLARRSLVYANARESRPERWARQTRSWNYVEKVELNPPKLVGNEERQRGAA